MATSAPSPTVHLAVLQPELTVGAPLRNMHTIRQMVDRLASDGPLDLVVLPESFALVPGVAPKTEDTRQARQFLSTLARSCSAAVVGGSVPSVDRDGKVYNACYVLDAGGNEIARYDKRRLFARESEERTPGRLPTVVQINGWRLGVLICADVWWPELARAMQGGIDVLCVPAHTAVPAERYVAYARKLWHALALTRAMENGVAVAVADWPRMEHHYDTIVEGRRVRHTHLTCGAATVADPSHRPDVDRIQSVVPAGESGALRAAIDLDALQEYRDYRRSVGLLPGTDDIGGPSRGV